MLLRSSSLDDLIHLFIYSSLNKYLLRSSRVSGAVPSTWRQTQLRSFFPRLWPYFPRAHILLPFLHPYGLYVFVFTPHSGVLVWKKRCGENPCKEKEVESTSDLFTYSFKTYQLSTSYMQCSPGTGDWDFCRSTFCMMNFLRLRFLDNTEIVIHCCPYPGAPGTSEFVGFIV